MVCVADTRTLVWYLSANVRLGKRATSLLERPDSRIVIPTIAKTVVLTKDEAIVRSGFVDTAW